MSRVTTQQETLEDSDGLVRGTRYQLLLDGEVVWQRTVFQGVLSQYPLCFTPPGPGAAYKELFLEKKKLQEFLTLEEVDDWTPCLPS